jgi:hypothetical protein
LDRHHLTITIATQPPLPSPNVDDESMTQQRLPFPNNDRHYPPMTTITQQRPPLPNDDHHYPTKTTVLDLTTHKDDIAATPYGDSHDDSHTTTIIAPSPPSCHRSHHNHLQHKDDGIFLFLCFFRY